MLVGVIIAISFIIGWNSSFKTVGIGIGLSHLPDLLNRNNGVPSDIDLPDKF